MAIDRTLKNHYDKHRAAGTIPPELEGKIPGGLYDGRKISMADLRNWRKGLAVMVNQFELSTALDDLLFDSKTGLYNMIDYKSKAKLTDEEDTIKYYQTQADCYDLALNANGYPTDGWAYFAYYAPIEVEIGGLTDTPDGRNFPYKWHCQVIRIKANHDRAKALTSRGGECLAGNEAPGSSPDCEQCAYLEERNAFDRAPRTAGSAA